MPDPMPSGQTPTGSGGPADEQRLILDAQNGDREAFRALVERHMKLAYDVAFGLLNDHDGAEDITQEAFVRVYEALDSFRGEAGFGTWLYRIVTNLSLNRLKQIRRRRNHEISSSDERTVQQEYTHTMLTGETTAHVERALHELPTMQRAVLILRHIDGLSTRQVSSILGCSEGTVKTHLFSGLEKMRKKLVYLKEDK